MIMSSVANGIEHIFTSGAISQIGKPIVIPNAINMAHLAAIRRITKESSGDQCVDSVPVEFPGDL